jgi:hypothetical protein
VKKPRATPSNSYSYYLNVKNTKNNYYWEWRAIRLNNVKLLILIIYLMYFQYFSKEHDKNKINNFDMNNISRVLTRRVIRRPVFIFD